MSNFNCAILTASTGFSRIAYTASLFYLQSYFAHNRIYEDGDSQCLRFDYIEKTHSF